MVDHTQSVILFSDGESSSVHVSRQAPSVVAKAIADYFENYSTDEETTKVIDVNDGSFDVEMNCRGDEHTVAQVFPFSFETVKAALKEINDDEHGVCELAGAGVLPAGQD